MRSVLITGTSTGFGRITAVELARRGWRVFATMRDLDKNEQLEAELTQAGVRERVAILQLDVTDAGSVQTAVAAALREAGGQLDAVVHNAGVAAGGAFEDLPGDDVRRVMETNFFGVLELTRALLPAFRAQRRGRIVIISSDAAFVGQPANAIYCASKWAIEGWAEAITHELAPFGIDVVLVEPGPYVTDIWQRSRRICPDGSVYRQWVQQAFRAGEAHLARHGGDAKSVAIAIAKALEARRPAFRNPVGNVARLSHALRGKLPSRLLHKGIARYLGLHRVRP